MFPPGAYRDFREASQAVLEYLHKRIGFDLWMVTRVEGEEWIILQVEDHGYGVVEGTVFRWADAFCYEMVRGGGPNIAPRVDCVDVYANAGMSGQVRIGAYIGFPLLRQDGSLFGTLCGVHPAPQPQQLLGEHATLELLARLLASVLNAELKTVDGARREERMAAQRFLDPITDAYDRQGWQQLLSAEEERCRKYGNPACVLVIELGPQYEQAAKRGEDAVEDLLNITAGCIASVTRTNDVVARVGPGTFAVLAVECDRGGSRALVSRLNESLAGERVDATIGVGHRTPPVLTLAHAWDTAAKAASGAAEAS